MAIAAGGITATDPDNDGEMPNAHPTSTFSRQAYNGPQMAQPLSQTATFWQLIGIILMSVGLGGGLLSTFERWLRGDSLILQLVVAALFIFSISVNARALLKRLS